MNESLLLYGVPPDPGSLRVMSYGQFTSMQVRDGRVDGFDLHFDRRDRTTTYGVHPPSADVIAKAYAAVEPQAI